MADPDDDPLEGIFTRARDRGEFVEVCALQAWDMSGWRSAVSLLIGCDEVWRALGADVIGERSVAPAIRELEQPRRPWSSSEKAVMQWAVHFWDVDRWPTELPDVFEQFYFQRWITACHLRHRTALTVAEGGR